MFLKTPRLVALAEGMKALLDSFNFDLPSLTRSAGQVYWCDRKCCTVIKPCSSVSLLCMLFVFFMWSEKPFINVMNKQASDYVHFKFQNPQEPCCNASVDEIIMVNVQKNRKQNKNEFLYLKGVVCLK